MSSAGLLLIRLCAVLRDAVWSAVAACRPLGAFEHVMYTLDVDGDGKDSVEKASSLPVHEKFIHHLASSLLSERKTA